MRTTRPLWPILAALILAGCGSTEPKIAEDDQARQDRALAQKLRTACASKATYARLKQVVFDEAIRIRNADPVNLDTLSTHALIRVEEPVVKSRDETLDITVCSGRFILQVPPGAERAFEGKRQLVADIEYAAQAAADGSGLVYSIKGAEPIIYRLAAFDLKSEAYRPARPAPQVAVANDSGTLASNRAEQPPPAPSAAPTRVAPVTTASAAPRPAATQAKAAEQRAATTSPSFSCRAGRSRSERMVCASDRLASLDRQMSSQFYSALSRGDDRQRAELRRTRDRFLDYRERCSDESCVAQAYLDRMDEIRDISGGG
jgi:uncharacterized protein YecT (DUF1311 family)